jgi:hypothetical protein
LPDAATFEDLPGQWQAPVLKAEHNLPKLNLGITSIYLQGIDNSEIIDTIHARAAPMLPASAGLR